MESKVFEIIAAEQARQNANIELIASENFVSENVMRAVGSCLTNKYSEGYPAGHRSGNRGRYYGGCGCVDELDIPGRMRTNLPTAVVEAVDPIVLDTRVDDGCKPRCCECGLTEIPAFIARSFGEELVFDDSGRRRFYVTLGQFTLVRLERDTQLLIPVYDYCIPQSECSCGDQEDPCGLFRNVAFPIGEFFPPSTLEMPKDYASTRSYCACH